MAVQFNEQTMNEKDMREFMMIVRQALLMICRWIEKKYGLYSK